MSETYRFKYTVTIETRKDVDYDEMAEEYKEDITRALRVYGVKKFAWNPNHVTVNRQDLPTPERGEQ